MENNKGIIYCSGPLFCPEEIGGMTAISNVLEEAGYQTFLPHRDGLEYYLMPLIHSSISSLPSPKKTLSKMIFALDVFQIVERCDAFVFNMNGRVPDEGGVSEAGIAFAAGKPLVIYKNDNRSVFNGDDNAMVSCLSYSPLISDIQKIPEVISQVTNDVRKAGGFQYEGNNIPPAVKDTVALGRKIWNTMKTFHLNGGAPKTDIELIQQISDLCSTPNL